MFKKNQEKIKDLNILEHQTQREPHSKIVFHQLSVEDIQFVTPAEWGLVMQL